MDVIKLINKALSDEDIGTVLGADTKIIRYSELRHIYDLDGLQRKFTTALSYTKTDRTEAIGLLCQGTVVFYEHFDSYGNKPDKTLEWVNMQMRRMLKQSAPYLTTFSIASSIYTTTSSIKTAPAMSIRAVRVSCIGSTH